MNTQLAQRMEDVQSNISRMKSEDFAWHEEQIRKEEEERRLREAMRLQQSGGK